MRKILFRGKRKDNGNWIYGTVVYPRSIKNENYVAIVPIIDGESVHSMIREVIPETVGQFTGLYDKNEQEIFEGDICRTMVCDMTVEKDCGIVCYDSMGILSLKRADDVYSDFFVHINIGCVDAYSIEVIGNIHDNPELLEVKG